MPEAEAHGGFLRAWGSAAAEIWATFRVRWRVLLLAGLVIFVPLGLLETIDASLWETVGEADEIGVGEGLELVGVTILHTVGALFGEVIFAGVVTASVLVERRGSGTSLRGALAELSPGRLALADVAYVLVVAAGFLALIVPGFVFMVWFALLGPVIEVEHLRVREAFRRSREVVRVRPWLVAGFVIPLLLVDEAVTNLAHEAAISALGETFAGEWAGGTLTELLSSLPLALAVVVLYFRLSPFAGERRSSPRTRPPGSPRSRREPAA